jgi:hypothetical protein
MRPVFSGGVFLGRWRKVGLETRKKEGAENASRKRRERVSEKLTDEPWRRENLN